MASRGALAAGLVLVSGLALLVTQYLQEASSVRFQFGWDHTLVQQGGSSGDADGTPSHGSSTIASNLGRAFTTKAPVTTTTLISLVGCRLDICKPDVSSTTPTLFVREVSPYAEKLPSMLLWTLFTGLELAVRQQMRFGGLVVASEKLLQDAAIVQALTELLGPEAPQQLLFTTLPTLPATLPSAETVETVSALIGKRADLAEDAVVELQSITGWFSSLPPELTPSSKVLQQLRSALARQSTRFDSEAPSIAVHVRRGGQPVIPQPRGTLESGRDSLYETTLQRLREAGLEDADTHAWITRLDADTPSDTKASITFFTLKGARVEEAFPSLTTVLANMVRADVLLATDSPLSWLAAWLTPNCVVAMDPMKERRRQWAVASSQPRESWGDFLKSCLPGSAKLVSHPKFCSLPICNYHPPEAARIFVQEHGDGAGHRMKNTLDGLAVARRFGLNFGGLVPVGNIVTEHGHNFRTLADEMFGRGAAESLFIPNVAFDQRIENPKALEQALDTIKPGQVIFMPGAQDWLYTKNGKIDTFFPLDFVHQLRQHIDLAPVLFEPQRPWVALHLRRGDLKPGDSRATPNEYYVTMIQHVRHHWPNADVHLWSSINSYSAEMEAGKFHWKTEDFDVFRQMDVTVHLDGPSLLDCWVHMARADVFISSLSSFSAVPELMNANCVIYPHNLDWPRKEWVDGRKQETQPPDSPKLKTCLEMSSHVKSLNSAA